MTSEFLRLYAMATLRKRRNPVQLSRAIRCLTLAIQLGHAKHINRCLFLVRVHGGVL